MKEIKWYYVKFLWDIFLVKYGLESILYYIGFLYIV